MAEFKISEKVSDLQELRINGRSWGFKTGLQPLDEIYSITLGYPLFLAGSPGAGKTEVMMEIMINTMVHYGWNWCCYFGEGGEVHDIFADLCHKLIGKAYKQGDYFSMTESEKTYAEMFFDDHLILIDDSKDYTLSDYYDEVKRIEQKRGIKFQGTIFDPFNDVVDRSSEFGGRDDKWLADELKLVRRTSKSNNRIDVLITHISDVNPVTDKATGNRYIPMALPSEWALGRTWWRRAFVMLMVYRPKAWQQDEHGMPYGENVTLVCVQKAKPKGTAFTKTAKLFFDWQQNKYFWKNANGMKVLSYDVINPERKPEPIQPNLEFTNTEAPF